MGSEKASRRRLRGLGASLSSAILIILLAVLVCFTAPPAAVAHPLDRVGALTLGLGEPFVTSAVIDPAGGFAYFATGAGPAPARIVKVRLSDFTSVAALTLNSGEVDLRAAVIDPAAGYAYFGSWTRPARIVKVRLSDFTRFDALTLNDEEYWADSAVIDPAAGYAYFGLATDTTGKIARVRLSDFTHQASPRHIDPKPRRDQHQLGRDRS